MQLRYTLTALVYALCCADTVVGRHTLQRRQDPDTTSPATTDSTPTPTDSTITGSTTETSPTPTESTSQTSTDDDEQPKTETETSSPKSESTITTSTSEATRTPGGGKHNGTAGKDDEVKLPIEPEISPALGIAGVVLLLTGVAYAIIGIKHQWLVVFFSAAYLTALAVVVLIIYVMNPPVSDAIQGAYMVAALLTGLIFGGISLIFREVTEGLSCLLGGFCIAMWFLVLQPGGLIESTTGRAIMIAAFAVVGWSLSFSQYTRNYGMIVCTAFAGAEIAILGIDCFSRAGLKEFWIYLWDLNDQQFPINTKTYPMTRGIRVEIAGTIVLFLFGLMSQFKIWKVVRERRTKREERKLEESKQRELRDSAIGKNVEASNERSLAQWEAVYGDKNMSRAQTDSGMGTSIDGELKKSSSVTEREIEMGDMSGAYRVSRGPHQSVEGTEGEDWDQTDNRSWWSDARSAHTKDAQSMDDSSLREMVPKTRPPMPGGPSVVPLPFLPTAEPKDAASGATSPVSETSPQERSLNVDALQRHNEQVPVTLTRLDDDRASSVAATADDEPDLDNESLKRRSLAPFNFGFETPKEKEKGKEKEREGSGNSPFSDEFREDRPVTPQTLRDEAMEDPMDENDDEILVPPPVAPVEVSPEVVNEERSKKHASRSSIGSFRRSTGSMRSAGQDRSNASDAEEAASVHSLGGHLPEAMSKVAMTYRTNEWAKHIAEADQPELEDADDQEPGVQVDVGRPKEEPRPVDPKALVQPAPVVEEKTTPRRISNASRQNSREKPRKSSSSTTPTPVYSFSRNNSQQSLQRPSSSSSARPDMLRTASAAAFAPQTLESPIEEEATTTTSPYLSTPNLLDERTNRLSRRTTTTNFNVLDAASKPAPIDETTPSASVENLTLAERKALLDQGIVQPRRLSNPATPSSPRRTSNPQPHRSKPAVDTTRQTQMLTQWRQSLMASPNIPPEAADEQARQTMLAQRQQAGARKQRESLRREERESRRDVAMRTGQLTGAHQRALQRMQAKAKTGE